MQVYNQLGVESMRLVRAIRNAVMRFWWGFDDVDDVVKVKEASISWPNGLMGRVSAMGAEAKFMKGGRIIAREFEYYTTPPGKPAGSGRRCQKVSGRPIPSK